MGKPLGNEKIGAIKALRRQGLSHIAIAERLGVSVGAAHKHTQDAKAERATHDQRELGVKLPPLPAPVDPNDPDLEDIRILDAWLAEAQAQARKAIDAGELATYAGIQRLMFDGLERRRKMRPPPPPSLEEVDVANAKATAELVERVAHLIVVAEDEEQEKGACYRCGMKRKGAA